MPLTDNQCKNNTFQEEYQLHNQSDKHKTVRHVTMMKAQYDTLFFVAERLVGPVLETDW